VRDLLHCIYKGFIVDRKSKLDLLKNIKTFSDRKLEVTDEDTKAKIQIEIDGMKAELAGKPGLTVVGGNDNLVAIDAAATINSYKVSQEELKAALDLLNGAKAAGTLPQKYELQLDMIGQIYASRFPEVAPEADIPKGIKVKIDNTLQALGTIASSLQNAIDIRGSNSMDAAQIFNENFRSISMHFANLEKWRGFAAQKGLSAEMEAYIESQGGEPDVLGKIPAYSINELKTLKAEGKMSPDELAEVDAILGRLPGAAGDVAQYEKAIASYMHRHGIKNGTVKMLQNPDVVFLLSTVPADMRPGFAKFIEENSGHDEEIAYQIKTSLAKAADNIGAARFHDLDFRLWAEEREDSTLEIEYTHKWMNEKVKLVDLDSDGETVWLSNVGGSYANLEKRIDAPHPDHKLIGTVKPIAGMDKVYQEDLARLNLQAKPASNGDKPEEKSVVQKGKDAMLAIMHFIPKGQRPVIADMLRKGDEREGMAEKMLELKATIDGMPETYGQDGMGDKAVAYLHYFSSSIDRHITEKDVEGGVKQAFGLGNLGQGAELGYISIEEMVNSPSFEIDLYWTPKTLGQIKGIDTDGEGGEAGSREAELVAWIKGLPNQAKREGSFDSSTGAWEALDLALPAVLSQGNIAWAYPVLQENSASFHSNPRNNSHVYQLTMPKGQSLELTLLSQGARVVFIEEREGEDVELDMSLIPGPIQDLELPEEVMNDLAKARKAGMSFAGYMANRDFIQYTETIFEYLYIQVMNQLDEIGFSMTSGERDQYVGGDAMAFNAGVLVKYQGDMFPVPIFSIKAGETKVEFDLTEPGVDVDDLITKAEEMLAVATPEKDKAKAEKESRNQKMELDAATIEKFAAVRHVTIMENSLYVVGEGENEINFRPAGNDGKTRFTAEGQIKGELLYDQDYGGDPKGLSILDIIGKFGFKKLASKKPETGFGGTDNTALVKALKAEGLQVQEALLGNSIELPQLNDLKIIPQGSGKYMITGAGFSTDIFDLDGVIEQVSELQSPKVAAGPRYETPLGALSQVDTAMGTEVDTKFKVIEAKKLKASNNTDGTINPEFPSELQPRDRTRAGSIAQVQTISTNLKPKHLGDSVNASQGAPIVGGDNAVESGNGRTMAIKKAYKEGNADEYRAWIIANAAKFGLKAEMIEGMEDPILVRERITELDRVQFAKEANKSDLQAMSPLETAKTDAQAIDDAMMYVFEPSESGDLLAASNRSFVSKFMQAIGGNDASSLMTADGQPNQAAQIRMQAAVFAKAFNDERLIALSVEETTDEQKNIIKAMNNAAPAFIEMRALSADAADQMGSGLADGIETSLDQEAMSALTGATELIRQARRDGHDIKELIKQQGLFGDIDPSTAALAIFISENGRSSARLAEAFKLMALEVNAELIRNRLAVADMFGEPVPVTLSDILNRVGTKLDVNFGSDDMQPDLLTGGAPEPEVVPEPVPEVNPEPGHAALNTYQQILDADGIYESEIPDGLNKDWILFNAPRPLVGDDYATGPGPRGQYWVAIDPRTDGPAIKMISNNFDDNAIVVVPATLRQIVDAALIDNDYADTYREDYPDLEKLAGVLGAQISRMEGKPVKVLLEKLKGSESAPVVDPETQNPEQVAIDQLNGLVAGEETDHVEFDKILEEVEEVLEKAGRVEEFDDLLNQATDKLTELLSAAAGSL